MHKGHAKKAMHHAKKAEHHSSKAQHHLEKAHSKHDGHKLKKKKKMHPVR